MKTTSQVTVITCDLCRKPQDEFITKKVHAKGNGISHTLDICSGCILELKRQLSFFNLTFWVEDGKGHFNSHAETVVFYIKSSRI